jgi:hypothetical protein
MLLARADQVIEVRRRAFITKRTSISVVDL